jgi:hypothetical protein
VIDKPTINNIYITDENVEGPAVDLARAKHNLVVIRDVDTDVPCPSKIKYDVCLFHYAIEHNYILVTGNHKDFEYQFYQYIETHDFHPGIVFIPRHSRRSHELIADWLALLVDEDLTNRIVWIQP